MIPDFLIAAHAQLQADQIAAKDRGYLRRYFSNLRCLQPQQQTAAGSHLIETAAGSHLIIQQFKPGVLSQANTAEVASHAARFGFPGS